MNRMSNDQYQSNVRVDLHIHTTASDGTWSPEELVNNLREAGIQLFAVTDHDSTANLAETAALAKEQGLQLIKGVEVNTSYNNRNYHILGLGIDPGDTGLQDLLKRNRDLMGQKDDESIEYLEGRYPGVSLEEYMGYINHPERGGWKALNYLIDQKLCHNHRDFFDLFRDWGNPFERLIFATPQKAALAIKEAGGVPILAHPGAAFYDKDYRTVISYMIEAGIGGIECYHPENSPEITRYCLEVCQSRGLVVSGGSDCHGDFLPARWLGNPDIRLGQLRIDEIKDIQ